MDPAPLRLHAKHAARATPLRILVCCHLLGDLHVDVEELADAAVEADGFGLVEVGLAVGRREALLGAAGHETVVEGSSALLNHALRHLCKTLASNSAMCVARDIPVEHVRHHLDLGLSGSELLLGRGLLAATKEERHAGQVLFGGIGPSLLLRLEFGVGWWGELGR